MASVALAELVSSRLMKLAAIDYAKLWRAMVIAPAQAKRAEVTARLILAHLKDYQAVEAQTGVPWHFIGAIHYREADLNFQTHLANGDPLGRPTRHVPAGLLAHTWPEGAVQALAHEHYVHLSDWDSIQTYASRMEGYNGWGYRMRGVTSPYLWAGSNQHLAGKFVADRVYDPRAIDRQLGGLVVLHALTALPNIPAIHFKDL